MVHTLTKDDGPADLKGVERLIIGASWDPSAAGRGGLVGTVRRKIGTDLDAIAVGMSNGEPVRMAGLDSLDPFGNSSLIHSGDNQTGQGEGDDETITVNFTAVPPQVDAIVFLVAAYKKRSSFTSAQNIAFNVYDATGGSTEQVASIWPSLMNRGNACRVARAFRSGTDWKLEVFDAATGMGTIKQGDQYSLMRFAMD